MLTLRCPNENWDKTPNSAFYSLGWPLNPSKIGARDDFLQNSWLWLRKPKCGENHVLRIISRLRSDPILPIAPIIELIFASSLHFIWIKSVRYNGRYLEKCYLESKENKHKNPCSLPNGHVDSPHWVRRTCMKAWMSSNFGKFATELLSLIDVRIEFLFNILKTNRPIKTKFCKYIISTRSTLVL